MALTAKLYEVKSTLFATEKDLHFLDEERAQDMSDKDYIGDLTFPSFLTLAEYVIAQERRGIHCVVSIGELYYKTDG